MGQVKYKKLVGRSLLSTQSCYLGEDHLLVLDGRFREQAKRIRYRDVEAVLICPTKAGSVWALLSALAALFFGVVAGANAGTEAMWVAIVLAALCAVVFVRGVYVKGSALLGFQTGVQTVRIEGAGSLRKARRLAGQLIERVERAQGALSFDELEHYREKCKRAKLGPPVDGLLWAAALESCRECWKCLSGGHRSRPQ